MDVFAPSEENEEGQVFEDALLEWSRSRTLRHDMLHLAKVKRGLLRFIACVLMLIRVHA